MKIGSLELKNNLLLAPIAGFSDAGMRALCRRYGAALTFTEMVSAKGLYYKNENTKDLLFTHAEESPKGVQLFGSQPEIVAYAVAMKELSGFDIIDINMGCPVPKIVRNGEGSALMTDPGLVYEIMKAAVSAAGGRPVSAKIRAGFTDRDKNAVEVAQALEQGGASAVTVHGRTRDMYYGGKVDLDIIKQVKLAIKIPVIGNGDVTDKQSYLRMTEQCGVDGVMVARGAIGRPQIFAELAGGEFEFDLKETILTHIALLNHLPERVVTNNMKKQVAFYVKGRKNAKIIKEKSFAAESMAELKDALELIDRIY
ncbi:MAG: tRNA dihydrouridine synthase DusB [Clostridia bacterium]|nr:tRNA dihydrouridine synthase DusB [Clostridia bacterium]